MHGSEEDVWEFLSVLVRHDDLLPLVLRVHHPSHKGLHFSVLEIVRVQLLVQHAS